MADYNEERNKMELQVQKESQNALEEKKAVEL